MKKLTAYFEKTLNLTLIFTVCSVISVSAATFTVTNANDSGMGSLRQALADADTNGENDTINFDPAFFNVPRTITLTSGAIVFNATDAMDLTINGPGVNLLTISGNNASRIFTFDSNTPKNLSGMTLTNGSEGAGGAIYDDDGGLSLSNMVITGNTATDSGGGVYANAGNITIDNVTFSLNTSQATTSSGGGGGLLLNQTTQVNVSNSTFDNNNAANLGGGIFAANGDLTIENTTITNNSGVFGGGMRVKDTNLTINGSTISNNNSSNQGGGIQKGTGGNLIITDSTISGNETVNEGGGMFAVGASATITGSTFSGNKVMGGTFGGGGIGFFNITANITNSTISGNTSTRPGGGIRVHTTNLTLSYVTVANNSTTSNGGGVANVSGSTVNFGGTLIGDNSADGGGPDLNGTFNSQGYNLIENTSGANIVGTTTGNITGQDPMLSALANNGGPTETHSLPPSSPAVDAGDPANFPTTDQRGNSRPADGNFAPIYGKSSKSELNLLGSLPDIGAFERLAPTVANVSVSGRVLRNGRGVPNVIITSNNGQGNIRTIRTNPFGYFRFNDIEVGQTYIFEANSKNYVFAPQVLTVSDSITNLSFTPINASKHFSKTKM